MSNMQRNMVANTATMSTQSSNRCSRILSGRLQGCQKWTWGLAMRCSHLVRQTHEAVPDAASKAGHGMCRRWEHTERIIRQRQVAGTLSTRMCGLSLTAINCNGLVEANHRLQLCRAIRNILLSVDRRKRSHLDERSLLVGGRSIGDGSQVPGVGGCAKVTVGLQTSTCHVHGVGESCEHSPSNQTNIQKVS